MAKLDDIRAKARAGLAAARRGIASGARSTALGARRLGRRASAMTSRERRAFCARTAAQSSAQVLRVVNEAVQLAADKNGLTLPKIDDAGRAITVGKMLAARKDRLSRLASEAALHAGYALTSGDENEWNEAAMYADDALDEGKK